MYSIARPIRVDYTQTPPDILAALRVLSEEFPVSLDNQGDGTELHFSRDREAAGVCRVVWDGPAAQITYSTVAAGMRGVGAVISGIGENAALQERCSFSTFGIMLDCSRNAVMKVEHFKAWLRRLALMGYNMAMLYTEDTYQLAGEPYFGYMRGAYSPDELREIDSYAAKLGIEMIACFQTLGHLEKILKWPAYAAVKDTASVLLANDDRTYALIEKMLDFWGSVFRSRRVHLGMDETQDLGRGNYIERFGYEHAFDILNRHLRRVAGLCEKRGLKPMIWSDMYFRLGSPGQDYYYEDPKIPRDVVDSIPENVELVYWDYCHDKRAFYASHIERHRALGKEPIVASSVRTWGRPWYDARITERTLTPCIQACKEVGVGDWFATLWGDDGGYCAFDSAMAGLCYSAQLAYAEALSEENIERRFRALVGGEYRLWRAIGEMNGRIESAGVLWDDPLLGIYLHHMQASKGPDVLQQALDTNVKILHMIDSHAGVERLADIAHAKKLVALCSAKIACYIDLRRAYMGGDTKALEKVAGRCDTLAGQIQELAESFRSMWLGANKPFGLEVIQIRFAGQIARFLELRQRVLDYCEGGIDRIEELDAQIEPEQTLHACRNNYGYLATAHTVG